jgi:hypothetical protein
MPEIAEYWARIHAKDDEFNSALTSAEGRFRGFVGSMTGMAASIGTAVVAAGAAIAVGFAGAGILKSISAASDLNETLSKTKQVFGGSADEVIDAAQQLADRFGLVKTSTLDAASSIGLVAKASGLTQAEAARMGVTFAKLGADASSFFNVSMEDALMAIRSGLVGESEPMRRFGVLLSESAVAAEALRLGLARTKGEISDGDKVQARASLIIKGMSDANGDLERTSGAVANQVRNLQGQFENLAADLGTAMLPAVQQLLPVLSELGQDIGEYFKDHSDEIGAVANAIGSTLVDAIHGARGAFEEIIARIGVATAAAQGFITALSANLPGVPALQGGPGGFMDSLLRQALPAGVYDQVTKSMEGISIPSDAMGEEEMKDLIRQGNADRADRARKAQEAKVPPEYVFNPSTPETEEQSRLDRVAEETQRNSPLFLRNRSAFEQRRNEMLRLGGVNPYEGINIVDQFDFEKRAARNRTVDLFTSGGQMAQDIQKKLLEGNKDVAEKQLEEQKKAAKSLEEIKKQGEKRVEAGRLSVFAAGNPLKR